jgi:hypothetical protein
MGLGAGRFSRKTVRTHLLLACFARLHKKQAKEVSGTSLRPRTVPSPNANACLGRPNTLDEVIGLRELSAVPLADRRKLYAIAIAPELHPHPA